jgi:hypothetical protein
MIRQSVLVAMCVGLIAAFELVDEIRDGRCDDVDRLTTLRR